MEEDSPLWASVAAEAFRDTTFGMIDVRILESGRHGTQGTVDVDAIQVLTSSLDGFGICPRYVQKRVSSKVYQAANKEHSFLQPNVSFLNVKSIFVYIYIRMYIQPLYYIAERLVLPGVSTA